MAIFLSVFRDQQEGEHEYPQGQNKKLLGFIMPIQRCERHTKANDKTWVQYKRESGGLGTKAQIRGEYQDLSEIFESMPEMSSRQSLQAPGRIRPSSSETKSNRIWERRSSKALLSRHTALARPHAVYAWQRRFTLFAHLSQNDKQSARYDPQSCSQLLSA